MNEKELQAYIERINKKLKYYYGDTYKRMLNLPEVQKAIKKGAEDFKFSNYTTHKVDKIVAELTQIINTNLQKGIANAWSYGIDNTTNHLSNAFGRLNEDYKTEIDKTVLQATKDIRNKTKESYRIATEKKGGLNISERVWNYNDQIKKEMEIAIQNGIKQGKSADDIARNMQKYLNNPNALFRRVRNKETGELKLSKAAKEYHPGQGVYRSAYKNAMRLITTEVNAAYREAEWASYQNNPLIKGYEIRLSNNHTILRNGKRVPFYDICDELQGIYPKKFRWTGWHPHCYSSDTEVMTDNGWKLFKDVEKKDLIFSLNPDTKYPEFVKWVNFIEYYYNGKMIQFKNKSLDLLVTPDHSMIYLNKSNGMIMDNKLAFDYKSTNGALYRSSEYNKKDIYSIVIGEHIIKFDLFCEFMGYWLADGYTVSTRENVFGITQTKSYDLKTYAKIVELSKKLPFKFNCEKERISYRDKDMYNYLSEFGKTFDKYIPESIKNASQRQIKIFLDAFICCDGMVRKPREFIGNHGHRFISEKDERVYFTSSQRLASDLGELLVKIGKRPSYLIVSKKGTESVFKNGTYKTNADCYRISECNGKTASVFNKMFIDYSDFVYDLELEKNHILYVRRNGKCVWGSNCRCIMIPILLTEEEFASRVKARKEGTLDEWKADEIKDMPDNYKKYVDENKARFGKLKNKPSWLLDDKQGQKDVNFYTKEGSGKMNSYLRGIRSTIDDETKTKISNISNYLNNAEKYKGTTYRGITLTEAQFQEYLSLKKGNMYIDKGFVSTTKSEGIINRFLGSSQYQAKFIIHSKNGVDIAPISDNKTEQEILFNKETKFIVNKIKVNKKGYAKSIIIELLEP